MATQKQTTAKLSLNRNLYNPSDLALLSPKTLRKEYSRLRSIARKRLIRIGNSEFSESQVYQINKNKFKTLREIKSDRELRYLLTDVADFITANTGSLSGLIRQRDTAIETLNENGYDFITTKNFNEFAMFMEFFRTSEISKIYDSEQIAEFFNDRKGKNIQPELLQQQFYEWVNDSGTRKENINRRNSDIYREYSD